MARIFDLSVIGAKELEKTLAALEGKIQRKVVSNALVKSRTRNKKHILVTIRGDFFKNPTGDLARIWKATKLISSNRRGVMVRGIRQPEDGNEATTARRPDERISFSGLQPATDRR